MIERKDNNSPAFLHGGGEMGDLIRSHDWASTDLGPTENWPQSLKTVLGIILNSRFPKFLFWGPDLMGFYNDAYRPSLGQDGKHPTILGMKGEFAWPELWDIIKPMINEVMNGGESTWSEDQLLPFYRNGKIEDIYWTFSYSPVYDESGNIGGVLTTCTETTEKVNSLTKLAEINDQLNFAIDATELGTWDLNPFTNKFTGNNRLKEWFGLAPDDEIELKHAVAVIEESQREKVTATIEKALDFNSGGLYDIEYDIINLITNQPRTVRARGRAWFNDDKIAYRFNGTLQDVTAQAVARMKMEESEKQFRNFADTIQNLAWTANAHGSIYWYNQRFYDYTGATFDEIKEFGWQKVHHPDHLQQVLEFAQVAWTKDEVWELTFPLRRHDGEYRWFLTRAYPEKNAAGEIERWIGTNTDITEQKMSSAELEKKVKERTEELDAKNIQLELSNAELASFNYIASHDLKEPLRKIQTFSRRILEVENLSEQTRHYFDRIIASGDRMHNLIESLIDFSRASTSELIFNASDLNTIVEEAITDLEVVIHEKRAVIEYANLPTINGAYIQLSQLFTNLIENSIKYSRPDVNPIVKITSEMVNGSAIDNPSADKRKEYHKIKIVDNGIGFDETYVNKIFQLFQRLHHQNEYSGTGIGLAIVKKIVTNHDGFIIAQGEPNVGATFTIYFPVE